MFLDGVAETTMSESPAVRAICANCSHGRLPKVPNDYLTYYYFPEHHLEAVRAAGYSRAESLMQSMKSAAAVPSVTPTLRGERPLLPVARSVRCTSQRGAVFVIDKSGVSRRTPRCVCSKQERSDGRSEAIGFGVAE